MITSATILQKSLHRLLPPAKIDHIADVANRSYKATGIFALSGLIVSFSGMPWLFNWYVVIALSALVSYLVFQALTLFPDWVKFGVEKLIFPVFVFWFGLALATTRAALIPEFYTLTQLPPDTLSITFTAYAFTHLVNSFLPNFNLVDMVDKIAFFGVQVAACIGGAIKWAPVFLNRWVPENYGYDEKTFGKLWDGLTYIAFIILFVILFIPMIRGFFKKPLDLPSKAQTLYLAELEMGRNAGTCHNLPPSSLIKFMPGQVIVADRTSGRFYTATCTQKSDG